MRAACRGRGTVMNAFTFQVPQNILFGMGCLERLPELLQKSGSRHTLIISDRGLEALGMVERVARICEAGGVGHTEYLDVMSNPTSGCVDAAVERYRQCGATSIVALGGGSPMDVAKAVGVLVTYGGRIMDYEGGGRVPGPIVPVVAIPTTAGTGSEVTAFSVIVDEARAYKLTVFSYELIPRYALLDPSMIMTLPPSVAASTGVDAMIHAIEAYLSRDASLFSDAMAEKALELLGGNLRAFVACRENEQAAGAMLVGAMFAGIAFAWARLGNVHAMSHPVSALFGVAHGVANGILLPTVLEYNALADTGRYARVLYLLTGRREEHFRPQMLVDEVRVLLTELGLPTCLSAVGVTEEVIPHMAADAMKSGNVLANPRQSVQRDLEALYRKAM